MAKRKEVNVYALTDADIVVLFRLLDLMSAALRGDPCAFVVDKLTRHEQRLLQAIGDAHRNITTHADSDGVEVRRG